MSWLVKKMAKKKERTKPGSELDWRVTYDTGSQKWTNDEPGDGKGDSEEKENLFDDLTVKRGIERLERAVSQYVKTGKSEPILSAAKKFETYAGQDVAKTVIRALYKAVEGDTKAKQGVGIAKNYVNRDRKAGENRMNKIAKELVSVAKELTAGRYTDVRFYPDRHRLTVVMGSSQSMRNFTNPIMVEQLVREARLVESSSVVTRNLAKKFGGSFRETREVSADVKSISLVHGYNVKFKDEESFDGFVEEIGRHAIEVRDMMDV